MGKQAYGAEGRETLEGRLRTPLLHLVLQEKCIEPIIESSTFSWLNYLTNSFEATYQRKKRRISRIQFWVKADRMHVVEDAVDGWQPCWTGAKLDPLRRKL